MNGNKKTRVYDILKKRIIALDLPPGFPINEADVAGELGVSKTPVREALRQLERDGLIENVPARGSMVTHITSQEVNDVFQIREILESGAARRAAALGGNEELLRELAEDRRLMSNGDTVSALVDEWGRWEDVHLSILRSLQNQTLLDIYAGVVDRITRIRNFYGRHLATRRYQDILAEHAAILDAICARDAELAERMMQRHLHNANIFLNELNTPVRK